MNLCLYQPLVEYSLSSMSCHVMSCQACQACQACHIMSRMSDKIVVSHMLHPVSLQPLQGGGLRGIRKEDGKGGSFARSMAYAGIAPKDGGADYVSSIMKEDGKVDDFTSRVANEGPLKEGTEEYAAFIDRLDAALLKLAAMSDNTGVVGAGFDVADAGQDDVEDVDAVATQADVEDADAVAAQDDVEDADAAQDGIDDTDTPKSGGRKRAPKGTKRGKDDKKKDNLEMVVVRFKAVDSVSYVNA